MKNDIAAQIDIFFSRYPEHTKEKGTVLIQAEKHPKTIFYLKQGIVRQYTVSSDGEDVTVNIFKPFAFFPMFAAFTDKENRYYFESITRVTYNTAPVEEVMKFVQDNPPILSDLLRRLYVGMDGVLQRLEYAMAANSRVKTVYTILNAAYRFGEQIPKGTLIPLRITHKEMATLAGTTRETLSREIKKLENENAILIEDNQIIVPDIEKLEELLVQP